jgi:hypothetical protein
LKSLVGYSRKGWFGELSLIVKNLVWLEAAKVLKPHRLENGVDRFLELSVERLTE